MRETQASISQWATDTFGPTGSNLRVATRANEEMAELVRAAVTDDKAKTLEEAADVVIVLCRLANRFGLDLETMQEKRVPSASLYTTVKRVVACANYALAGLLLDLELDDHHRAAAIHVQSVVGLLFHVGTLLGVDLHTEIDRKMSVNRNRTWRLDGSGHGYHVKEETVTPA